jgi:uncharacterized protein
VTSDAGPDEAELVIWRGVDEWRTEVAAIELRPAGIEATGTQIGVDPVPYRLDYRLSAPDDFVTRRLELRTEGTGWRRELELRHDGNGSWTARVATYGSVDLPAPGGDTEPLTGALDCDLGFSPLTNLLPVRRHGLDHRAGAADFLMAWVSVPDLAVVASAQRYEHIRRTREGAVVRYVDRGLFPGFTADLRLDRSGLVLVYPELAERVTGGEPG